MTFLRSLSVAVVLVGYWCLPAGAAPAEICNAYAAPNVWGPPLALKGHAGAVTYTVSYTALGNTKVVGEVTYHGPNGLVTRQFNGSITFRTGACFGQPRVRFKGIPFGSAVRVTVSP